MVHLDWTASLLYANYQTRKDAKAEEGFADKVIDKLHKQHAMPEKHFEKMVVVSLQCVKAN